MKDEAIDLQDLLARFTVDSICDVAFGVELGSVENGIHPFSVAFDECQELCARRAMYGLICPLWLGKYILPSEFKLRRNMKFADTFIYDIIHSRQKEEDLESRGDMLSRFICLAKVTII